MKYRKTALIEATQWHKMGDHEAVTELPEHARSRMIASLGLGWIDTLEGGHVVTPGDWIAGPGAKGEFWPIKPDVFAATYEPAE
jgi:hypothetical protein